MASVWRKLTHNNEQCFTVISQIMHASALYGIPGDSLECLLSCSRVTYDSEKAIGINRHCCFHLELCAAFNNQSGEKLVK